MWHEGLVLGSVITLLVVWVLLPMIPAILIYRLFPNTTVAVSGPLASLTVRAGGAFAGYLAVFAAIYVLVRPAANIISGFEHSLWSVTGEVKLLDKDNKPRIASDLLAKLKLTQPESMSKESYHVTISISENDRGKFPLLLLEIPQWGSKVIDLNAERDVEIDEYSKSIRIKDPIEIKEEPSAQNVPVSAPSMDQSTR
jgi:hypothetical protein